MLFSSIEGYAERIRAEELTSILAPHLPTHGRVLDLGAGSGMIAEGIAKLSGLEVYPVDVIDVNKSQLPLTRYDGERLPFADDAFDTTLAICMLHHADNPRAVLEEMFRVTSNQLLIFEDTPTFYFGDYIFWRVFDYARNHGRNKEIAVANHDASNPSFYNLSIPNRYMWSDIQLLQQYKKFALNFALYRQSLMRINIVDGTKHPYLERQGNIRYWDTVKIPGMDILTRTRPEHLLHNNWYNPTPRWPWLSEKASAVFWGLIDRIIDLHQDPAPTLDNSVEQSTDCE